MINSKIICKKNHVKDGEEEEEVVEGLVDGLGGEDHEGADASDDPKPGGQDQGGQNISLSFFFVFCLNIKKAF